MEDSGLEYYEDIVEYVLFRFQVDAPSYKILLLTDNEFDVFNYECDVIKTFYYMITQQQEYGYNSYRNKYLEMVTKEYGEFFYQSEDDSYISASLIHINKVYNTISPVYDAINILNQNKGTDKDVTFLHTLLTKNSEYDYLVLLREKRHHDLYDEELNDNKIYFDIIHEALHIVEHEKPPSWWKFWIKKHKDSEEMDLITNQLYIDLINGFLDVRK
jgi:hypothetical protein